MTPSCAGRITLLREMALRFEAMASGGEPLHAARLRQTAADLVAVADRLQLTDGADDVLPAGNSA